MVVCVTIVGHVVIEDLHFILIGSFFFDMKSEADSRPVSLVAVIRV